MRRRRILAAVAVCAVAAGLAAAIAAERGGADLVCDPPTTTTTTATTSTVTPVPGCPIVPIGTMSLDALVFGDHNANMPTSDIFSFSWGLTMPSAGAGVFVPSGAAHVHDLVVTRMMDKATPRLMRFCAAGTNLRSAEIKLFRSPGDMRPYMTVRLSDVYCSGFAMSSGGDVPIESLSLNFSRVELRHTTQEGQETRAGYDFKQNRAF